MYWTHVANEKNLMNKDGRTWFIAINSSASPTLAGAGVGVLQWKDSGRVEMITYCARSVSQMLQICSMLKLDVCRLVFPELGGKNVNGIERPIAVVHETPRWNKPKVLLKVALKVMLEDELNVDLVHLVVARFGGTGMHVSTG